MKPSTAGTAFQNVHKHNLLVMEGGRLAAEGFHIGMCLDGGLRVYTLAAAPGETETANWGNCPRHSWTLGEVRKVLDGHFGWESRIDICYCVFCAAYNVSFIPLRYMRDRIGCT